MEPLQQEFNVFVFGAGPSGRVPGGALMARKPTLKKQSATETVSEVPTRRESC